MVGEPVIRRGAHEQKLANPSRRGSSFATFGTHIVAFHLTVSFCRGCICQGLLGASSILATLKKI